MKTEKFFSIVSLGCSKNLVDSEVLCGQLAIHGYVLTDDVEMSQILIINTCGFLGSARDEADAEISNALEWREEEEGRLVVVSGCYPQKNPDVFFAKFPNVDLVIGIDDIPKISDLLTEILEKKNIIHAEGLKHKAPTYLYDHTTPRLQLTLPHFAYVKIADGCNHGCRYCSIPLIRGRQRSRTIESIVTECQNLLSNGTIELNLVAQDTSRYGEDLKDGTSLITLLDQLDQLKGHFWIRLLYFHPKYVSEELLKVLPKYKHVVPYVDIPLQHIATPILQAMGRQMNGPETRILMDKLRSALPNGCIRTTFIVGFPGETEENFNELLEYIKEYQFDRLGVFVYSPEPGTAAAKITEGLVPLEVAEKRKEKLMEIQQQIALKKNQKLIGQRISVLVDQIYQEKEKGKVWNIAVGRTLWDAPEVDNQISFIAPKQTQEGDLVTVQVVSAQAYDLVGEICKNNKSFVK